MTDAGFIVHDSHISSGLENGDQGRTLSSEKLCISIVFINTLLDCYSKIHSSIIPFS